MNILTDEEIFNCLSASLGTLAYARAIEAAVMSKLAEQPVNFPVILDEERAKYVRREVRYEETIESLRRELENERARDIHSCGTGCTRSGCVNHRLREELAEARQEIADRKADCETGHDQDEATIAELRRQLKHMTDQYNAALEAEQVRYRQLAASQAREQQLREMFSRVARPMGVNEHPNDYAAKARLTAIRALELPQDTTALQAYVAKAGEVMRERGAVECETHYNFSNALAAAIRALPAVTLDDLKGGA